jgi:DNA mismatch endonuclease (patch repair protein)
MADTVSKKKRSEIMRSIRSKNTKIEIFLEKLLSKMGYRFSKNAKRLIGKPDIVFRRKQIAIFIDSCFWHGCPYHCRMPHSNRAYWNAKIRRNKERDKEVNNWYKNNDWIILRFWEHTIQNNIENCVKKIAQSIKNN